MNLSRGVQSIHKQFVDNIMCITGNCVNPPNCDNGGYLNQYCQCQCPSGLTGIACGSVVSSPGKKTRQPRLILLPDKNKTFI